MTKIKKTLVKILLKSLNQIKLLFINLKKKPYLLFFCVLYGCLLSKFYINQKINDLYKEEKLLKAYKTEVVKLNLVYDQIIYDFLKKQDN